MRVLLTAFLVFFITGLCFANKPGSSRLRLCLAKEKKASLLSKFLSKTHAAENDSLSKDEFEQPKLSRQFYKKQLISCISLLHFTESRLSLKEVIRPYLANADFNTNFIYLFLYPKHVFW
jgi:hypothetical protein